MAEIGDRVPVYSGFVNGEARRIIGHAVVVENNKDGLVVGITLDIDDPILREMYKNMVGGYSIADKEMHDGKD